jgi:Rrf2 family iron-sulfur cluster assembly transcriptional regulator
MLFSKACEYGIKAAVYIALKTTAGERASLKDIASEIGSPEAYTAKILQLMVRENVIISIKGAMGGFEIEQKKLNKIKLEDIVTAIDGAFYDKKCALGLKDCSEKHPCSVHHKFKHIKKDIRAMLQNTSLHEMSAAIREGTTCLNF